MQYLQMNSVNERVPASEEILSRRRISTQVEAGIDFLESEYVVTEL